jgi:squalene synthase HpnD
MVQLHSTSSAPVLSAGSPMEHVRRVVSASGTSFLWGMRVLPKPRREAMYAVYAYCREIDDIADGDDSCAEKLAQLAEWRDEIDRLYEGRPTRPTTQALLEPVDAYELPREEFVTLIEGMEIDAHDCVRIADMAELQAYCRHVAGAVGKLSIRIFGAREPEAETLAVVLGEALQITNVLRDIAEDALRNRLYLPYEVLSKHGIRTTAIETVLKHPNLPGVCAELAHLTRRRFQEAEALIARCDRRQLRPAILMMQVYRRIFDRLVERGWQRLDERISLPKPEKLWVAFRYSLLS